MRLNKKENPPRGTYDHNHIKISPQHSGARVILFAMPGEFCNIFLGLYKLSVTKMYDSIDVNFCQGLLISGGAYRRVSGKRHGAVVYSLFRGPGVAYPWSLNGMAFNDRGLGRGGGR